MEGNGGITMASREIRVLFIQSRPVNTLFNAETAVHGMIMRHLDRGRVEAHVACSPDDVHARAAGAFRDLGDVRFRATHFFPSVNGRSRSELAKQGLAVVSSVADLAGLARYVRRHRIDVIHSAAKPRDALYGLLVARLTGAKSVMHLHHLYATWMSPALKSLIEHADGIIGVSPIVVDSVKADGVREDKLYSVFNGIAVDRWNDELDGGSVRAEFDIAPDIPIIACVGRAVPSKGQGDLIRALARIEGRAPDYRLMIVGEDDASADPQHGSYTAELRSLAAELHIESRVIFAGWRSDIDKVLAACDLFALPAIGEGFGLAYIEAMAMRRPVIAVVSGATSYIVEHGRTGLLSEPGDIHQLGENLLVLLSSPSLRVEMGECGRRRVEDHFSARRQAHEVEQVYCRVLGRD